MRTVWKIFLAYTVVAIAILFVAITLSGDYAPATALRQAINTG